MQYTAKDIIREARAILTNAGITHYRDSEFILEYVLGRRVSEYDTSAVEEYEYNKFIELIARRANHEPLDSLLGFTEFMGLIIPFRKETLSPRQETEIMVDNIIRENANRNNLKILDMCTGSGCIGLALKKYLNANVTLADVDESAIAIAQDNAERNNLSVNIVMSNLFAKITEEYDIIVSNPPYIPTNDVVGLEREVLDYDPLLALDGGEDGLILIRELVDAMPYHLNDGGLVYMEFGIGQSEDIKKLFEKNFTDIEIVKDYSGIDRYIKARKKSLC